MERRGRRPKAAQHNTAGKTNLWRSFGIMMRPTTPFHNYVCCLPPATRVTASGKLSWHGNYPQPKSTSYLAIQDGDLLHSRAHRTYVHMRDCPTKPRTHAPERARTRCALLTLVSFPPSLIQFIFLVTPGMFIDLATLFPMSRLMRALLPTLGKPITATRTLRGFIPLLTLLSLTLDPALSAAFLIWFLLVPFSFGSGGWESGYVFRVFPFGSRLDAKISGRG